MQHYTIYLHHINKYLKLRNMKTKHLFGVLLLLCSISLASCLSDDDEPKNKVQTVKMYVSSQTGTYQPWGASELVECMLIKEENQTEYINIGLSGISGFNYEKGYEYSLLVEKTTLAIPPADGVNITYKLIEVLQKEAIDIEQKDSDI